MQFKALSLLFSFLAHIVLAHTSQYKNDNFLERVIKPWVDNETVPSMAVAVINGHTKKFAAYGQRSVYENDNPVTLCDKYHIGSDTKAMTSTLIAQLVDKGIVTWDTQLKNIFHETQNTSYENITLSQLSSHTSGIPNDDEFPYTLSADDLYVLASLIPENLNVQRRWLVQQVITQIPSQKSGIFAYSNTGYIFLGAVIEKLYNTTWEQAIVKHIFEPVNLDSAGFGCQATLGKVDAPLPHTQNGTELLAGPACDNPPVMGPAGTVHMSVVDFAEWAMFNLHGDTNVVSNIQLKYLHTPVVSMQVENPKPGTPPSGKYAHGWGENTFKWAKDPLIFHGGSNEKNLAYIIIDKARDFAMVLMTNTGVPSAQVAMQAVAEEVYNSHVM